MENSPRGADPGLGIAAVERETGLSKDTLRIWERRYGFPTPQRDAHGDRLYPVDQVRRLRLLKQLLDAGHRPGRVVSASEQDLQQLLAQRPALGAAPSALEGGSALSEELARLRPFIGWLQTHQIDELRRQLAQSLLRMGLGAAITELIAPLTRHVGELWMKGELAVFEEHIYSECLQQVLRQAIQAVPSQVLREHPRVLLGAVPGEAHGLGLLMVEALLVLEGCQCLSVGVQTPLDDIVLAARAHRADIVGLSYSGVLPVAVMSDGLAQLRAQLPPSTELWAGGNAGALYRRGVPAGVRAVTRLQELGGEVGRWREATGPQG